MSFRGTDEYLAMQSTAISMIAIPFKHKYEPSEVSSVLASLRRPKPFSIDDLEYNTAMNRVTLGRTFGAALKDENFPFSTYDVYWEARTTSRASMPDEPWRQTLITPEECKAVIHRLTGRKRNVGAMIANGTLPAYKFSNKTVRISINDLTQSIQEL